MRKLTLVTALALFVFPAFQKAGIECSQGGFATAGLCLVIISHVLKLAFLVLLVVLMSKSVRLSGRFRLLLGVLCLPVFLVFCGLTLVSGRIVLNLSRPTRPGTFIRDRSTVGRLEDLAREMIQAGSVFWVGNGPKHFIFSIKYEDGDYQFDSRFIPDGHDFKRTVDAEDMSKVGHYDLPFQSGELRPTDKKVLDRNDYEFCKRASGIIRKIGFDNVKLYPDKNVVQYQICDFIGWDNGGYFVYYFCPDKTLAEEFKYSRKLNSNWYYTWQRRFPSRPGANVD
jgi:hypothetical protein